MCIARRHGIAAVPVYIYLAIEKSAQHAMSVIIH